MLYGAKCRIWRKLLVKLYWVSNSLQSYIEKTVQSTVRVIYNIRLRKSYVFSRTIRQTWSYGVLLERSWREEHFLLRKYGCQTFGLRVAVLFMKKNYVPLNFISYKKLNNFASVEVVNMLYQAKWRVFRKLSAKEYWVSNSLKSHIEKTVRSTVRVIFNIRLCESHVFSKTICQTWSYGVLLERSWREEHF